MSEDSKKREKIPDPVKGIKRSKKLDEFKDTVAIVLSDGISKEEIKELEKYTHVIGTSAVTGKIKCDYHVAIDKEGVDKWKGALGDPILYCPRRDNKTKEKFTKKGQKKTIAFVCPIKHQMECEEAAVFNCASTIGVYKADVYGIKFIDIIKRRNCKIGANVINIDLTYCG